MHLGIIPQVLCHKSMDVSNTKVFIDLLNEMKRSVCYKIVSGINSITSSHIECVV